MKDGDVFFLKHGVVPYKKQISETVRPIFGVGVSLNSQSSQRAEAAVIGCVVRRG